MNKETFDKFTLELKYLLTKYNLDMNACEDMIEFVEYSTGDTFDLWKLQAFRM